MSTCVQRRCILAALDVKRKQGQDGPSPIHATAPYGWAGLPWSLVVGMPLASGLGWLRPLPGPRCVCSVATRGSSAYARSVARLASWTVALRVTRVKVGSFPRKGAASILRSSSDFVDVCCHAGSRFGGTENVQRASGRCV